jgi:hypothetical protein
MALTKAVASVTDWTAVAASATAESASVDLTDSYESALHIQAFLDSTTANAVGTEFIIQVSSNTDTNTDEDWGDYTRFVELIGTAVTITDITNNPLAAGEGTSAAKITDGTIAAGYAVNDLSMKYVALEDATLTASEVHLQVGYTNNQDIWLLDGVDNAHANTTDIFNIAFSRWVSLPMWAVRARVVVNNNYGNDDSSLNFRVRSSKVTAL